MSIAPYPKAATEIVYPDSDGQPMADNTKQAEVMVFLKTNLDSVFAERDEVFVAMDLLWYPVEGHPEIRLAPDILVAVGRPKGYRGSYRQWQENDTPPQVVFEILSPGNRRGEMDRKFDFYQQYGVEEYYLYNPDDFSFSVWQWSADVRRFRPVDPLNGWVSPRLGVRFEADGESEWRLFGPDGQPFREPLEIRRELARVESERDLLAAKLRELGINPDDLRKGT